MRKFLIAVCALGLIFSAAGCGNSSESSAKAETKEVDESKNLDLLKKGFNSITKEEWKKIHISKKDFNGAIEKMTEANSNGEKVIKEADVKKNNTVVVTFNNSDGKSMENGLLAIVFDQFLRALYTHSSYYDGSEPTIRFVDLKNQLAQESDKPMDSDNETKDSNQDSNKKILSKPGETSTEDNGEIVTLDKIADIQKKTVMNSLTVTVDQVKLLSRTNISPFQLKLFKRMTDQKVTEPLRYIQITYKAENTGDTQIDWQGIESVETDNGQKLTIADNNILKGNDHVFAPHTENEGVIGAVYSGKAEDLHQLKITFFPVKSADSGQNITVKLD
ncbi:hypothetical protein [Bacillus atrophaeus]|uniref:hypothetical protein n=1 Tax=Bacillus atrophaeus TaxID=1452 RepID=UPI000B56D557|nr:hypothetical protein [Bacillus atrophaeus]ARW05878.1 hypothetical protein S101359_00850 [Bacillus atrophaeus]